jgi:NAD(P)-dependent dehydrogenase (short-subunit alcohol dehydrogenase family)
MAQRGFDIVGVDIRYDPENEREGLVEVKRIVEKSGREFHPIKADISDLQKHQSIIDSTVDRFGRIDVLVNNAGVAPEKRMDVLETSPESYDRVLSINARGAYFLTQKVAKHMIRQGEEKSIDNTCIIFISSISTYVSSPMRPEYCISKAALSMAAKIYADRLAEHGINVYEVRPGIIQTDMTAPVKEKYDKLIAEGLIPQKRWGTPEDVARAVAALAGGDFAYSTGLVVEVSGGMNIQSL